MGRRERRSGSSRAETSGHAADVDKLSGAGMLGSSNVVISTIQRVFKVIRNEEVTDTDDPNLDGYVPDARATSLEDMDNLPAPEIIAREIVEDLTAALVEFEAVAAALEASSVGRTAS